MFSFFQSASTKRIVQAYLKLLLLISNLFFIFYLIACTEMLLIIALHTLTGYRLVDHIRTITVSEQLLMIVFIQLFLLSQITSTHCGLRVIFL